MDHLCICGIGDPVSCLDQISGIDHILIKDRPLYKASKLLKNIFLISSTYIGAEICLDTIPGKISLRLNAGNFRIVERSRVTLHKTTLGIRKLSGIGSPDLLIRTKCSCQILNQLSVCRKCILCHKYHDICLRQRGCFFPGAAVIKFCFRDMMNFQKWIFLIPFFIPEFLLCIHYDDSVDRAALFLKTLDQPAKFFSRAICGNDHICCFFHCINLHL